MVECVDATLRHHRQRTLKQVSQSSVVIEEVWEPDGLADEWFDHTLKPSDNSKSSKAANVVVLNRDDTGSIEPNDSKIEKAVMIAAKTHAIPNLITAAFVVNRDDMRSLNDAKLSLADGAGLTKLCENLPPKRS